MVDDAKPQHDKLLDLTPELGADEDEARFEETVRKIAPKAPTIPATIDFTRETLQRSQALIKETTPD
jgi:hypothetical protein